MIIWSEKNHTLLSEQLVSCWLSSDARKTLLFGVSKRQQRHFKEKFYGLFFQKKGPFFLLDLQVLHNDRRELGPKSETASRVIILTSSAAA